MALELVAGAVFCSADLSWVYCHARSALKKYVYEVGGVADSSFLATVAGQASRKGIPGGDGEEGGNNHDDYPPAPGGAPDNNFQIMRIRSDSMWYWFAEVVSESQTQLPSIIHENSSSATRPGQPHSAWVGIPVSCRPPANVSPSCGFGSAGRACVVRARIILLT